LEVITPQRANQDTVNNAKANIIPSFIYKKKEVGTTIDNSASTNCTTFASYSEHNSYVLLPTAVVNIKDNEGNYKEAIALLDTASQSSYISEELHKKLDIRKFEDKTVVSGIRQVVCQLSNLTHPR
jgi:hypothetical protein